MLNVNRNADRAIWQQLLDQAIENITSGKWRPGDQLIPSRELAQQLGVSRSTVQIVYEELLSRGYIVTSRRGGTRVSDWNHSCPPQAYKASYGPLPPASPLLDTSMDRLHEWFSGKAQEDIDIDFCPHEPYLDLQFQKIWRQSFLHASAMADLSSWTYGDAFGYLPLRQQIQRYLSMERGVHIQPNQILLTSGAQHSLDLIAQALLSEGDTIAVEDPGFPVSWMTMNYRRMNAVPVPVDESGLVVDSVPSDSRLVFVTPSHQCASGVILSAQRRQQLIQKAIQANAWIIEDDYDSEFRYRGDPLPTLFSQAPHHTLYLMSFSKMIAPGIRISAIVGSVEAIARLASVLALTYRHLPIMEQLTLTHFISHGHFTRHMRRTRNVYRRRHEAMMKAIGASGLRAHFYVKGVETGLHILLEAKETFAEEEMTLKALQRGVRVYPLRPYCLESKRKGWVLGFAKVDEDSIAQGITRLAELLQ